MAETSSAKGVECAFEVRHRDVVRNQANGEVDHFSFQYLKPRHWPRRRSPSWVEWDVKLNQSIDHDLQWKPTTTAANHRFSLGRSSATFVPFRRVLSRRSRFLLELRRSS